LNWSPKLGLPVGTFPVSQLRNALLAKGFQQDKTHHAMFWLVVGGKKRAIRTRLSHGAREYGDALLGLMARQMRLRRRELEDFIRCPMDGAGYVELLIEHGEMER